VTTLDVDAPASGEDRYRAEVWAGNRPSTITSHVFLKNGDASFDSGCAISPAESNESRWLVVAALAVLVRRRTKKRR